MAAGIDFDLALASAFTMNADALVSNAFSFDDLDQDFADLLTCDDAAPAKPFEIDVDDLLRSLSADMLPATLPIEADADAGPETLPATLLVDADAEPAPTTLEFAPLRARSGYATPDCKTDQRFYQPNSRRYHARRAVKKSNTSAVQAKNIRIAAYQRLLRKLVEQHPTMLSTINSSGFVSAIIVDDLFCLDFVSDDVLVNDVLEPADFLEAPDFQK